MSVEELESCVQVSSDDGRTLEKLTQAEQLPTTALTLFEVWYIGHEE